MYVMSMAHHPMNNLSLLKSSLELRRHCRQFQACKALQAVSDCRAGLMALTRYHCYKGSASW